MTFSEVAQQIHYPFVLPALPFSKDALEPHMSAETFDYHHGKHHATYVNNLNKLLENEAEMQSKTLEDIIQVSEKSGLTGIFNNAAQVWNHTFFWHSMKQNGGGKPSARMLEMIENDFGSFDDFKQQFKQAGATQFGSGWVWLVQEGNHLKIIKTPNAETPITKNLQPLICCDVWEHAYYIDYRNKRPDFLNSFIENLVNWDFAVANLK